MSSSSKRAGGYRLAVNELDRVSWVRVCESYDVEFGRLRVKGAY